MSRRTKDIATGILMLIMIYGGFILLLAGRTGQLP